MYQPLDETLDHFIWRKKYFREDNKTPVFHYKMIDHYLTNNSGSNIKTVKAFRGSSKSTNTCYMALHRVENLNAHYTLIVSDTTTQAESLIADISDMLENSSLPYKVVRDVAGEIELLYKGKSYFLLGKGAGSSLRGIKRGRKRPDLVVLDDCVNDELATNKMRIDRLNRWFYKALLPSLSPNGEVWAVGTPLSQNDLFMHLCSQHKTLSIALEHGIWRDRFSDDWIDAKKNQYEKAGMLRQWKQEFELKLTDDESRVFDVNKIRTTSEDEIPDNLCWFMTLDGAFSEKESADYSAFACLGLSECGQWYVASYDLKASPQDVINKLFELQAKYNCFDVGIEKGAFQLAMQKEIESRQFEYQQYFNVKELSTRGSKISRIKALSSIINSGRLTIIDTGEPAERLMEQIELTDSTAVLSSHDDHIDAMAQLLQMDLYYSEPTEYSREDYMGTTSKRSSVHDLWK